MKRGHYFLIFIVLCITVGWLLSRNHTKLNYIVKVKLVKLTAENIYDKELIGDFLFDEEEMQVDSLKRKAEKLFLKGIDLYKNKKNAAASIDLFKQSILIFPSAKSYYTLGNALVDAHVGVDSSRNNFVTQSLKAYEVAEYLKFQPLSQLYFHEACAENILRPLDTNFYTPNWDMEKAFASGFTDTTAVKKNKYLNSIITTGWYKSLIAEMSGKKVHSQKENFFAVYKKSFPVISQPFEITADKVDMSDYKETMSYDFVPFVPEMENTQFGRNVESDYYFVGKIAETPVYTAVIYYSSQDFMGDWQPIYTKLVTYDTAGNIISLRLFACQFTPEKIRAGKIENNIITLQDYKRVWKYKPDSAYVENNAILRLEPLAKATFKLTESGKIIQENVPTNFSDSTIALSK
jgi:hypothetical protein